MTRDSIRALVDAATPGPWTSDPDNGVTSTVGESVWSGEDFLACADTVADAAFIAASRTAVPLLLAVADAAARQRQAIEESARLEDAFMNATGDTEADRLARVAAYREALAAGEALTEALAALEAQK